jgi:hypothetical protein
MYISVADSRIRGFLKWADTHEPNLIRDRGADADEKSIIAAPDLADAGTTYPAQPHRPWLVSGAGRL